MWEFSQNEWAENSIPREKTKKRVSDVSGLELL